MITGSITRNGVLLGLFAVLTTTLIAGTFLGTRDRIAVEQRKAQEKALLEILPPGTHDNSMLDDTLPLAEDVLGLRGDSEAYVARSQGKPIAVILPVTARDGYGGDVNLIVGIRADASVAGVRVLTHKETPGLGDKVDLKKSDWVLDFADKSLSDPPPERWRVKKDKGDFDQFTGATITPRAVVAAVKSALEYFELNRAQLLAEVEAEDG